jgi:hypothetical protein
MLDAEESLPVRGVDDLFLEPPLPGLEPVRKARPCGEIFESPMLGRLEFARMPSGRPSFWRGELRMPDSRYALQIVCEVDGDDLPGSDQTACVTAFRRLQVQDAMLCAPLINERLRELKISRNFSRNIGADDLVLTLIHLPPRPLAAARFELGFRAPSIPHLSFTVVFVRGTPRSVRVDSDN